MDESANTLEVARRYSAAVNARDWESLNHVLAPDVVSFSHSSQHTSHGPQEIIGALQSTAGTFSDTQIEVTNAFAGGDEACFQLVLHGTPGDDAQAPFTPGHPVQLASCHVYRVRDGQIVSITTYSDRTWRPSNSGA